MFQISRKSGAFELCSGRLVKAATSQEPSVSLTERVSNRSCICICVTILGGAARNDGGIQAICHGGQRVRSRGTGYGGRGAGERYRCVQRQRSVAVHERHPGDASCSAEQAVLRCGEEGGQGVHVQPVQGVVVPEADAAEWVAAAEEVRAV